MDIKNVTKTDCMILLLYQELFKALLYMGATCIWDWINYSQRKEDKVHTKFVSIICLVRKFVMLTWVSMINNTAC